MKTAPELTERPARALIRCNDGGMTVVKTLTKIGNSYGVIIERPILDLLKIDKDTPIELSTDGESLTLRPVRVDRAAHVREAVQRIGDVHAAAFEKLAK